MNYGRLIQLVISAATLMVCAYLIGSGIADQNAASIREQYRIFKVEQSHALGGGIPKLKTGY